jgi:hypothetical protein
MATNPVADLLAKQSRSKLKAMLAGLDTAEESIKAQRLMILDALEHKAASTPQTGSDGRGHTGTSAVLRQIMRESGGRVLMPREIIKMARERDVQSSDPAIRVALRRMEQIEGFIEHGPGGTGWRLVSGSGSQGEAASEAQISTLGEHGPQSSGTGDPSPGDTSTEPESSSGPTDDGW